MSRSISRPSSVPYIKLLSRPPLGLRLPVASSCLRAASPVAVESEPRPWPLSNSEVEVSFLLETVEELDLAAVAVVVAVVDEDTRSDSFCFRTFSDNCSRNSRCFWSKMCSLLGTMSESAGVFCGRAVHENVRAIDAEGVEVERRAIERREIILKSAKSDWVCEW